NPNKFWTANTRFTYQANAKNKFSAYYDKQGRVQPYRYTSPVESPEAGGGFDYPNLYIIQSRWTSPLTNRLLLEVAGTYHHEDQHALHTPAYVPGTYPHFEITTGKLTQGPTRQESLNNIYFYALIGNVSYVTGSHAFKFGYSDMFGAP